MTVAPVTVGPRHGTPVGGDPAVEVSELVKRYPKRPDNAVDGLSFSVPSGEIFGLLRPNGAGKSTTIGILTTRVRPTSGRARVSGIDVAVDPVAARARLAVVPQRTNLDRALTVRQNLVFHAAYHGVPSAERGRRADAALEQFGLGDRAGDKVDAFSGGMVQRLLIARATMHAPEVLFLDEPSTGLDPQARLFVWDRVRELRAAGVTIVLTTHDMDEATLLADRVGIIDHGKLLALDTPDALTRSLPGSATLDLTVEPAGRDAVEDIVTALGALDGVQRAEVVATPDSEDPGVRLRLFLDREAAGLLAPAAALLSARDAHLSALAIGESSLEDVFLSLTGRELR